MAEQELRTALIIEKFPHGGFGVKDLHQEGRFAPSTYLFASDGIDDALAWVKKAMLQTVPQLVPVGYDAQPGTINRVG